MVLVYPKTGYDWGIGIAPPHSILSLAAYLRSRHVPNRVVIIDQRTDPDWQMSLNNELKAGPLLVGISAMTGVQLKNALAIAGFVRRRSLKTHILFGGVHVSLLPEQSLNSELIDFGITGEGEESLLMLVNSLNACKTAGFASIPGLIYKDGARVVKNEARTEVDMNTLPIDRFEGIDVERYLFGQFSLCSDRELDIGETSRGCRWRCAYCYNTVFHGGKWHSMSAVRTIEMIAHNVEKYNLKSIWIRDDNFFVDAERAAIVIEYIARRNIGLYLPGITIQEFDRLTTETRRNMARIKGLILRFGVESGSDAMLRFIRKGITAEMVYRVNRECRELGCVPSYNFMIGFPRERREDVYETIAMMKKLKHENPEAQLNAVNFYTPYPGTALFEIYRTDYPQNVPDSIEEWTSFHHLNVKKGDIRKSERRLYENIVEISYLISDTLYQSLSGLSLALFVPIRLWFVLRWRLNAFRFAPEILLVRKLKKIFLSID